MHANVGNTQIAYDKYFELETNGDYQYKALSLEGYGVLIMETGVGIPEGKTTVNYTLLDNDLNVRSRTDVVYESEVYYNGMEMDSSFAYLVFVNSYGDFLFEKFDLIHNKNSRFSINLNKVGDLMYSDFSPANPYVIRNHANIQYTVTVFDLEAKTYATEFIDVSEIHESFSIEDCKIDECGENLLILSKYVKGYEFEINRIKINLESHEQQTIKLMQDSLDKKVIQSITDYGFDGDDIYLISNYHEFHTEFRRNVKESGLHLQRFSEGDLTLDKKYTSKDFSNYSVILKGMELRGIIPNAEYRRSAIPSITNAKLIIRPNGRSFLVGYIFFSENIYRLPPNEYDGRLYQMIVNFDLEWNILWDRQIRMQAPKSSEKFSDNSMNMLYSASDDSDQALILLYQNAKLTFLELTENGDVHLKQHQKPIVKYHAKDKVKTSNSKIIYGYDQTFFHVGIKQIKNKSRNIPDYKYLLTLGKLEL